MSRGAKRINPSLRSRIETLKCEIRGTKSMFDGEGYIFKTAIKELRKEGVVIIYDKDAVLYYKEKGTNFKITAGIKMAAQEAANLHQAKFAIVPNSNPYRKEFWQLMLITEGDVIPHNAFDFVIPNVEKQQLNFKLQQPTI